METKRCSICKTEKPLSEYYKSRIYKNKQHYQPRCKKCFIDYYKQNKEERIKYQKKWVIENIDKVTKHRKKWSKENPDKLAKSQKAHGKKYPDRIKARNAINQRLFHGRLVKLPCVTCQAMPTEAHHPDYSKPLHVVWLCRRHHLEVHGRVQRTFNT